MYRSKICVERWSVLIECWLLTDKPAEFAVSLSTFSLRPFSFMPFLFLLNWWITAFGIFLFGIVVCFLFPLDPENMLFIGGLGKKIGILTCIKSITICIEYLNWFFFGGEWAIVHRIAKSQTWLKWLSIRAWKGKNNKKILILIF